MQATSVSLVIPFYNEAALLQDTVERCLALQGRFDCPLELIFVDDGSRDRGPEIARRFAGRLRLVSYPDNRGKGHAVRRGVLASAGELVLITDADLAYGTEALLQAARHLEAAGADLLCGSRRLGGDGYSDYPPLRRLASRVFARYVQGLLHIPVGDSQCGLKALRGEAARALFRDCVVNGFAYDLELLGLAQRRGYRLCEMPVAVQRHGASSVSLLRDSLRMAAEVLRIRARLRAMGNGKPGIRGGKVVKNYYVWRPDCADCAKVDRWMAEMAAVMPELRPAIETFERLERPQAEALGLCCDELPALFVEGERLQQGAPGKRGLLMLLQEVRRRLEAQD